jgi:hypothetical protein
MPPAPRRGGPLLDRRTWTSIQAAPTEIAVYASPRIGQALEDIRAKNDLYEGVRLLQVLEAVYAQGKKDGAREVFDSLDKGHASMINSLKRAIPHKNPGRLRKS